jgi:beta-glucanase (GH16 family)
VGRAAVQTATAVQERLRLFSDLLRWCDTDGVARALLASAFALSLAGVAPVAGATSVASTRHHRAARTQSAGTHLTWSDEFNGQAGARPDPAKWSFDTGGNGWGNNELQYYTSRPRNAALDGKGDLVITARRERYTGIDGVTRGFTSARMQTFPTFQFTYGLIEARIQVPAGQGLLPAFWMLGNEAYNGLNAWPGCGETDAMEVLGSEPSILNGTVHGPWPSLPNGLTSTACNGRPTGSTSCWTDRCIGP